METQEKKTQQYKFITPWEKINRDNSKKTDCGELYQAVEKIPEEFASRAWLKWVRENCKTVTSLIGPYQKHSSHKLWHDFARSESNFKALYTFFHRTNMAGKHPNQFNPEAWEEYQSYSIEIGARFNTVEIKAKAIRRFFSWLYDHEICEVDYSKFILTDHARFSFEQLKKKPPKAVTPEMYNRILNAIPEHQPQYKLLVALAYHTGLRMQDLALLNNDNIDWKEGKVTVLARKNGEFHEAKLPPEILQEIRVHMDEETGFVMPVIQDSYVKYKQARIVEHLRRYFDKAKAYGYSLHDFRRTKVMQGQALGYTAEELATSLGHKRVQTTLNYYVPMDLESQTFIQFNLAAQQLQAIDKEAQKYGHRRHSDSGLGQYDESVNIANVGPQDTNWQQFKGIGSVQAGQESNIIRLQPDPRK